MNKLKSAFKNNQFSDALYSVFSLRMLCATICLFIVLAFTVVSDNDQSDSSPALKSVSLFNLPTTMAEADLIAILTEMNEAVEASGYPAAGYRLWKVSTEQDGDYAYMVEGNWPSQSVYDSIHRHEAYLEMQQRLRPTIEKLLETGKYNRYTELR